MSPTTRGKDGRSSLIPPQIVPLPIIEIVEISRTEVSQTSSLERLSRIIVPLHITKPTLNPIPTRSLITSNITLPRFLSISHTAPAENTRIRAEIPLPTRTSSDRRSMVSSSNVRWTCKT